MKPTAKVMRLEFLLCLDVVCVCGGWGGTPWGGPLGCGPGPLMCVYTEGELSGSFCCGWFLLVF